LSFRSKSTDYVYNVKPISHKNYSDNLCRPQSPSRPKTIRTRHQIQHCTLCPVAQARVCRRPKRALLHSARENYYDIASIVDYPDICRPQEQLEAEKDSDPASVVSREMRRIAFNGEYVAPVHDLAFVDTEEGIRMMASSIVVDPESTRPNEPSLSVDTEGRICASLDLRPRRERKSTSSTSPAWTKAYSPQRSRQETVNQAPRPPSSPSSSPGTSSSYSGTGEGSREEQSTSLVARRSQEPNETATLPR
jgi:hypothetical protein